MFIISLSRKSWWFLLAALTRHYRLSCWANFNDFLIIVFIIPRIFQIFIIPDPPLSLDLSTGLKQPFTRVFHNFLRISPDLILVNKWPPMLYPIPPFHCRHQTQFNLSILLCYGSLCELTSNSQHMPSWSYVITSRNVNHTRCTLPPS